MGGRDEMKGGRDEEMGGRDEEMGGSLLEVNTIITTSLVWK